MTAVDTRLMRSVDWYRSQKDEVARDWYKNREILVWPREPVQQQLHRTGVVFMVTSTAPTRPGQTKPSRPHLAVFLDDAHRELTREDVGFAVELLKAVAPGLLEAQEDGDLEIRGVSARDAFPMDPMQKHWGESIDRTLTQALVLPEAYLQPEGSDRRRSGSPFWEMRTALLVGQINGVHYSEATRRHFRLDCPSHDEASRLFQQTRAPVMPAIRGMSPAVGDMRM